MLVVQQLDLEDVKPVQVVNNIVLMITVNLFVTQLHWFVKTHVFPTAGVQPELLL
jgi:hypothetical protein